MGAILRACKPLTAICAELVKTSAEIMLGTSTVEEYLLSPVQKAWHEAGKDR